MRAAPTVPDAADAPALHGRREATREESKSEEAESADAEFDEKVFTVLANAEIVQVLLTRARACAGSRGAPPGAQIVYVHQNNQY